MRCQSTRPARCAYPAVDRPQPVGVGPAEGPRRRVGRHDLDLVPLLAQSGDEGVDVRADATGRVAEHHEHPHRVSGGAAGVGRVAAGSHIGSANGRSADVGEVAAVGDGRRRRATTERSTSSDDDDEGRGGGERHGDALRRRRRGVRRRSTDRRATSRGPRPPRRRAIPAATGRAGTVSGRAAPAPRDEDRERDRPGHEPDARAEGEGAHGRGRSGVAPPRATSGTTVVASHATATTAPGDPRAAAHVGGPGQQPDRAERRRCRGPRARGRRGWPTGPRPRSRPLARRRAGRRRRRPVGRRPRADPRPADRRGGWRATCAAARPRPRAPARIARSARRPGAAAPASGSAPAGLRAARQRRERRGGERDGEDGIRQQGDGLDVGVHVERPGAAAVVGEPDEDERRQLLSGDGEQPGDREPPDPGGDAVREVCRQAEVDARRDAPERGAAATGRRPRGSCRRPAPWSRDVGTCAIGAAGSVARAA